MASVNLLDLWLLSQLFSPSFSPCSVLTFTSSSEKLRPVEPLILVNLTNFFIFSFIYWNINVLNYLDCFHYSRCIYLQFTVYIMEIWRAPLISTVLLCMMHYSVCIIFLIYKTDLELKRKIQITITWAVYKWWMQRVGLKTEARTNCIIIVQIKYAESDGLCGTSPKENCQFKFLEIVLKKM